MTFYRTLLAAAVAFAVATPVLADDAATPSTTEPTAAVQSSDQTAAAVKVNLNTASAKDLMKVKGLNASKARAIVAYRKKHGDFKSTDDLAKVKGFKKLKPDTLQEITGQVSVE